MADTTIRAGIAAQNERFMRAANGGDAAALAALYPDDATLLPPGAAMIRGRPGIEAFWAAALQQIEAVKLTSVDVADLGDGAAREIGRVQLTPKGQDHPLEGKYVVVWKRLGGEWQLDTDIWNMDA